MKNLKKPLILIPVVFAIVLVLATTVYLVTRKDSQETRSEAGEELQAATLAELWNGEATLGPKEEIVFTNPELISSDLGRVSIVNTGTEIYAYFRQMTDCDYFEEGFCENIRVAISSDNGKTFTIQETPAFDNGNIEEWGHVEGVFDQDVVIGDDGIFYMVFEFWQFNGQAGGIGLAKSPNGLTDWTYDATLIIVESLEYHSATPTLIQTTDTKEWYLHWVTLDADEKITTHHQSLIDLNNPTIIEDISINQLKQSNNGEWDYRNYGSGNIIEENNYYYMFFEGANNWECLPDFPMYDSLWGIGWARQYSETDVLTTNWNKYTENPLFNTVGNTSSSCWTSYPEIVLIDGTYYLYYKDALTNPQTDRENVGTEFRQPIILKTSQNYTYYVPVILEGQADSGNSFLYIRNNTNQTAQVTVNFFGYNKGEIRSEDFLIKPYALKEIKNDNVDIKYSSAIINSSQDVTASIYHQYRVGTLVSNASSTITAEQTTNKELNVPALFHKAYGESYYTHLYIQNAEKSITITPQITLYNATTGEEVCSYNLDKIPPRESIQVNYSEEIPCNNIGDLTVFSAKIESKGEMAAEVHEYHYTQPLFSTYKVSVEKSQQISIPGLYSEKDNNLSSSFSIMNQTQQTNNININLYSSEEYSKQRKQLNQITKDLESYTVNNIYLPEIEDLSLTEWSGSTIITGKENLIGFSNTQTNNNGFYSTETVAVDTATDIIILPFLPKNYVINSTTITSSITIQNLEDKETRVYIFIFDKEGNLFNRGWDSFTLEANSSKTYTLIDQAEDAIKSGKVYTAMINSTDSNISAEVTTTISNQENHGMNDWETSYIGDFKSYKDQNSNVAGLKEKSISEGIRISTYKYDGTNAYEGHTEDYPRCSFDNDETNLEAPSNSIQAEYVGDSCVDWFTFSMIGKKFYRKYDVID